MPGGGQEGSRHLLADGIIRNRIAEIAGRKDAQKEHRQHRPHRAQRHKAKGIFLDPPVAQHARNADAQRHDEGHRNGARGHAAGIKGHGQQRPAARFLQNKRQRKQEHVEQHEDLGQGHPEYDFQHRDHEERPHTQSGTDDQHRSVHDRADLICQDLQVRLRHSDEHPQQKAYTAQKPQFFLSGQSRAHQRPHGGHGKIRTQTEQANAQHQQHRAHRKGHKLCPRQVQNRGQCQQIHQRRNRERGNQRLPDFIP